MGGDLRCACFQVLSLCTLRVLEMCSAETGSSMHGIGMHLAAFKPVHEHSVCYWFQKLAACIAGGVATILTLLMRKGGAPPGLGPIRCVAIGPAPVLSRPLAEICNEFVISVIHG